MSNTHHVIADREQLGSSACLMEPEAVLVNDIHHLLNHSALAGRAAIRYEELVAAQKYAWRRVAAARGQLSRALKVASAERIATARQRVEAALVEASRISSDSVAEMRTLSRPMSDDALGGS